MANTIDTYGDAAVMAALLTRSFAGVGYEFACSCFSRSAMSPFA